MKKLFTFSTIFGVLVIGCGSPKGTVTSDELAKIVFEGVKNRDFNKIMSVALNEETAKLANEITGRNFSVDEIKRNWTSILETQQSNIESILKSVENYKKAITDYKPNNNYYNVRYHSSTRDDSDQSKLSKITIHFESSVDPDFKVITGTHQAQITAIKIKERWLLISGERFQDVGTYSFVWSEKDESERQDLRKKKYHGESLKVEVLNGCGVNGLERKYADLLREYGFDPVNVATFERRDIPRTVVIDHTSLAIANGQKVARALGLPEGYVSYYLAGPEHKVSVTLILGRDYTTILTNPQ